MFANMASFSVEVIEADNPLEVLDYSFIADTAGPGKYRGGVSLSRTIRMLAHEGILQVRSDRKTHRPYGLYGGGPGSPSLNVLVGERELEVFFSQRSCAIEVVREGQLEKVYFHVTPECRRLSQEPQWMQSDGLSAKRQRFSLQMSTPALATP